MVSEYVAKYGGNSSGVNSDVAEAYAVGQVTAQAVKATGGLDKAKIISYLHSGVTLDQHSGPSSVRLDRPERQARGIHLPVAGRQVRPGAPRRRAGLGVHPVPEAPVGWLTAG